MVLEINEVTVAPGQGTAFETAFARARRLLLGVSGCLSVELLRRRGEPGRYQVQVAWEQLEDHVEHYPRTDEAAQVRALLGPLIASMERGHYEVAPLD